VPADRVPCAHTGAAQVQNIRKVTDSSGEAILAVEDLVHDDHLVI